MDGAARSTLVRTASRTSQRSRAPSRRAPNHPFVVITHGDAAAFFPAVVATLSEAI
jgi:hypothetical protein